MQSARAEADATLPVCRCREAASRALDAIGLPARDALRKAAAESKDPEVLRRAKRLAEVIENRLDTLLAVYQEYGLPLPPQDAPQRGHA